MNWLHNLAHAIGFDYFIAQFVINFDSGNVELLIHGAPHPPRQLFVEPPADSLERQTFH